MVNNNKYLIVEIGSKLYLGIENSFDKKKRLAVTRVATKSPNTGRLNLYITIDSKSEPR